MKKLLVQFGFVFSCAILFAGCSNEGSLPAEAERDAFFDPLPRGLPVFTDIDEAFVADSEDDSSRSALFTYQRPENPEDSSEIKEVFAADARLVVALNTVDDRIGRSEFTLLVKNDSVYAVNHLSNQIRLLSHFTNTVCELIPREKVVTSAGLSTDKKLTVLHDEVVYVMTAEGSDLEPCDGTGKKRFYALPLDHQLDPSQTENGQLSSLELVNESLARSHLIFGWVTDPDQAGQQILSYGYLGYGLEEITSPTLKPALVLYNAQREQVWRQDRSIAVFPLVQLAPEKKSKTTLFHLQALANQHYLVQLGLDVFLVDAGTDLLSKKFDQSAGILSDRILRLTPERDESSTQLVEYAAPARTVYDEEDLLIVDGGKIFHSAYQAATPVRNPSESYEIILQNLTDIASRHFADKRYFSQFDLQSCDDDAACLAAHDVIAQNWQFISPCEEALGCSSNEQVVDFCETAAEKLNSQSDAPLCTASDYRHLSELNAPENDMALRGFMQYADDYVRKLDFTLESKRLYITAAMLQKDVLLRYNYALDFSAPKSQREQVLFGKHAEVYGVEAHFVASNLFMTALTKASVRSNECYKNYRRVRCDLGEMLGTGSEVCTGRDLAEGICINQFQEFESHALFCDQSQLMDATCSDDQIATLSVEYSDEDAKWLKLVDYRDARADAYQMKLLIGNHQQAQLEQKLDEGRLLDPVVYDVEITTGQALSQLGRVTGLVEQAVHGWVTKDAENNNVEVLAHLQLISDEVISSTTQNTQSELVHYLIEQSFADASSSSPVTKRLQKLGVSRFERP
jgi:hypothetical protein